MNILKKLISIGAEFEDPETSSTIKVQNSFALASTLLAIPFEVYFGYYGLWNVVAVYFLTQVVLMISFWLSAKGHIKSAKVVVICIFAVVLPLFNLIIGAESGFYVYYLLGPSLVGALFDFSERRFFIASIVLTFLSVVVCFVLAVQYPTSVVGINASVSKFFFKLNFGVCFIILSYVTYHMVRHHYQTNGQLKMSNRALKKLIREKEVLLAEVHHRVKNNMAVMSSLMNLQIHQANNEEVIQVLKGNSERLKSMSLIHDYLYDQKNFDEIDFRKYIEALTKDLILSYQNQQTNVRAKFDIENITIPLNKAIPLGLIANEIIVNSFKHAFVGRDSGLITVEIKCEKSSILMTISDDGVGIPENKKKDTLGSSLIEDLVEQLDGEMAIHTATNKGTSYKIELNVSPE